MIHYNVLGVFVELTNIYGSACLCQFVCVGTNLDLLRLAVLLKFPRLISRIVQQYLLASFTCRHHWSFSDVFSR
jgi:hypothetical protein